MIDIHADTLITLAEAAAMLPDRPHVSTLHRWRMNGVQGVRLETVQIGRKRYTSHEALARFVQAVTAAADREPRPTSSASQTRKHEQAKRELAAAGFS